MDYEITIITSILNGKDFIKGFLEDVERQTMFKQSQLVMVDANSDEYEETEKHIHPFVKKHDNVSYHKIIIDDDNKKRNIPGVYKVWNTIIKEYAQAEILTNWNIDDRRHPDHIKIHYDALTENPAIHLAYAPVLETLFPNETMENNKAHGVLDFPDYSIEWLFQVNMPHNSPVWKRSIHDSCGYFDETFFSAGDYDLWIRAALDGKEFLKVSNDPLALYYKNPNGISTKESTLEKALVEVASVRNKYLPVYLKNVKGSLANPVAMNYYNS